jgi:hypothetical protein
MWFGFAMKEISSVHSIESCSLYSPGMVAGRIDSGSFLAVTFGRVILES